MTSQQGWSNEATRHVATQVRAEPFLYLEVLDRINGLQNDLSFDQARAAAGAEVHAVWACRADDAPVDEQIDWPALGESFLIELLGRGIER